MNPILYKKLNESCKECPLYDKSFVPWQIANNKQYDIMLIGQAPGHIETLTKKPFTGPAGKMEWRLMKEAGIDKSRIYVSNMAACAPPNDRKPTVKEIKFCAERLKTEIKLAKPKLIIAAGDVAIKPLTGKSGATKQRGEIFDLLDEWDYGCKVLCTLHPSFVMRQRQWIDIAVGDLEKAVKFLKGGLKTKVMSQPEFVYHPPAAELSERFAEMSKHITAVDIETPGQLDILTADIIGIAFYAGREAIALDFTNGDDYREVWEVMKRFLEDPSARKCTQNGQFDVGVLASHGIETKGLYYDTLLAEHVMQSDLPGNLDFLRSKYTNVAAYKPTEKEMKAIGTWTPEQRMEYNCWDVVTTWEVMNGQLKEMNDDQLKVLREIELPLVDVCNYMERKGLKVDVDALHVMKAELEPKMEALKANVFGPLELNPASPVQLKKYFGIADTQEDTLKAFILRKHQHAELMQSVLDFRAMQKSISTYLVGIEEKLRNGRIHAHPVIEGAATGRLSYRSPNLQNIPKNLRSIYIPDSKDFVFLDPDYSQLELRVAALVAPEESMRKEFDAGLQIHHGMGMDMFKKEWDELSDLEKRQAKGVVFGSIFGRSARSIAIEQAVPVATAEEWRRVCFDRYPGLKDYIRRQEHQFLTTHQCSTAFGRIRFLQTVLQAFNTPIQGTAADVMKTSLIEIFKAGIDLRITIHDEVVVQVERKLQREAAMNLKKIMERPIEQLDNYKFPIKMTAGENWRDVEEYKL